MFKKATRLKLRFQTEKGLLSVEQLWDLNLTSLATIVRNLKSQLKKEEDDDLSFLDSKVVKVDDTIQIMFEVVKDIYITKKDEADAIRKTKENKEHNQKIMEIISRKKEESLQNLSVEELEKMMIQ